MPAKRRASPSWSGDKQSELSSGRAGNGLLAFRYDLDKREHEAEDADAQSRIVWAPAVHLHTDMIDYDYILRFMLRHVASAASCRITSVHNHVFLFRCGCFRV